MQRKGKSEVNKTTTQKGGKSVPNRSTRSVRISNDIVERGLNVIDNNLDNLGNLLLTAGKKSFAKFASSVLDKVTRYPELYKMICSEFIKLQKKEKVVKFKSKQKYYIKRDLVSKDLTPIELNTEELLLLGMIKLSFRIAKRIKNSEFGNKTYLLFRQLVLLRGDSMEKVSKKLDSSVPTLLKFLDGRKCVLNVNRVIDYLIEFSKRDFDLFSVEEQGRLMKIKESRMIDDKYPLGTEEYYKEAVDGVADIIANEFVQRR